jgi:hypothetical protein
MFAARSGAKTLKLVTKKIRIIFFKKNQKKYDLFFQVGSQERYQDTTVGDHLWT